MSQELNIVCLTKNKPVEKDWLERLMAPLGANLIELDQTPIIKPGTVFLYNSAARLKLEPKFVLALKQAGNCGLIHVGDEYFRTQPSDYQGFDFVVRMYPFEKLMGPGMLGIPLGLTNNMGGPIRTPASERKNTWMFAGNWKADRGAMAQSFKNVPNSYLSLTKSVFGERPVGRDVYLSELANSVFAPCPAGNVCIETCRPYEALELGAIPLLPSRRFSNYFQDVLGPHPLPTFRRWGDAADFVKEMTDKPAQLDELQSLCLEWWDEYQERLGGELVDFVREGLNGEHSEALHNHIDAFRISPIDRSLELLSQQNRRQIMTRINFNIVRGFRMVFQKQSGKGVWSIEQERLTKKPSPSSSQSMGKLDNPSDT